MPPSDLLRDDCARLLGRWRATLDAMAGDTVLVTGAGGFFGAYLVDVLAAYNDAGPATPLRIVALDNFLSGLPERLAHLADRPDVALVRHDLRQPFEPDGPVPWIIHGASVASPPFYRRFPLETIDVNVNGTRAMLELARRPEAKGLVVLSTSEIYGDPTPDAIPTPETFRGFVSCTGPRACYDESKRLAETLCWIYHQQHGVPVKVVRPFNVYGPGQRLDDGRIIPDLMRAALAGGPLVLHSDGRATRAFCYARDAAAGLLVALVHGQPGEPYNLGNDEAEVPMAEVAALVARVAADPPLEVRHQASADPHYLTDNPQRRCPALGKLRGLAGWTPEVGMAEGLARTLASYREAPAQAAGAV